ncbi:hypothetical protein N617_gp19 [Stygiolobus rod-shaped virus]|uniref:Uncharacterized protein n=1 Tax=Stygiolobus rod-shaped virus TaxID=537009 RepID=B6EFC5_9VIRU|nr:hypothetical protein N617_gp19 [Stygiolobus rod-shaped virus]CAQ58460.1 hypothetical protein [Stygiolobus rod-shaped virus]
MEICEVLEKITDDKCYDSLEAEAENDDIFIPVYIFKIKYLYKFEIDNSSVLIHFSSTRHDIEIEYIYKDVIKIIIDGEEYRCEKECMFDISFSGDTIELRLYDCVDSI